MSKSLVPSVFYHKNTNENFEIPKEKPLKNYADYFFKMAKVDTLGMDVTNQRHVENLIKSNLNQITKFMYNSRNSDKSIFAHVNENHLKYYLGAKSVEILTHSYNELLTSISEVCYFIKQNDQNPKEIMDMVGITYQHNNLPPECDGLF